MTNHSIRCTRLPLGRAASVAHAALLGGWVNYSAAQLYSMSTVDICETQNMHRQYLSPEARQAIDSELRRRNDNCGNHATEVAQRYDLFLQREMYGKQDNP